MSRERSSIRCSISGALVASMSSCVMPDRSLRSAAPRDAARMSIRHPVRAARRPGSGRVRVPARLPRRARRAPRRPASRGCCGCGIRCRLGRGLRIGIRNVACRSREFVLGSHLVTSRSSASKLVSPLAASPRPSTCFLRSAISASRIASWNWLWNSPAMRRILVVQWPIARRTPGSSFGPITMSATTPMTTNSLQPMSNIAPQTPKAARRCRRTSCLASILGSRPIAVPGRGEA